MDRQRAIEARLRRKRGASPEARERIEAANKEATWRGRCRKCGAELTGTMDELVGHVCDG